MPNLSNIAAERADKKLVALVNQQKREHEHLLAGHGKEMQALRDQLSLALEKFKSVADHHDAELKAFKEQVASEINMLKEKTAASNLVIDVQQKTIGDLHKQILNFKDEHASKNDSDAIKKELSDQVTKATMSHLIAFQNCEREFKELFKSLSDVFANLQNYMQREVVQMNKKCDANFSILQIDQKSILERMSKYENDVFIIEKKLENIYTLIERLNKRGALCPKPE